MHTPYNPVPNWNASYPCFGYMDKGESTYCGMLWDADLYVGKIVDLLKQRGMYDNTLIVYFSDNGGIGRGINYPLRGEKHTNWEGGMRVPAFVSGGLVPQSLRGTNNSIVFHCVDWYPTLAKLAGVDPTDDPPVAPLPVDLSNINKDIYGNESFPPVDGVDIWDMLMHPQNYNVDSAHKYLTLSKEVLIAGDYKLLVSQPNYKHPNNGWRYPNGTWIESKDADWPCNKEDGPLDQILPGIPGNPVCLFNVTGGKVEILSKCGNRFSSIS